MRAVTRLAFIYLLLQKRSVPALTAPPTRGSWPLRRRVERPRRRLNPEAWNCVVTSCPASIDSAYPEPDLASLCSCTSARIVVSLFLLSWSASSIGVHAIFCGPIISFYLARAGSNTVFLARCRLSKKGVLFPNSVMHMTCVTKKVTRSSKTQNNSTAIANVPKVTQTKYKTRMTV